MSEIDHEYTDEIVCPWCGIEWSDSWEMNDEGEIECDECGKSFDYFRNVSVTWTTKRIRCKSKGCKLVLKEKYRNPYIYNNQNWTLWRCKICNRTIAKVSPFVGNNPRLELPVMSDF